MNNTVAIQASTFPSDSRENSAVPRRKARYLRAFSTLKVAEGVSQFVLLPALLLWPPLAVVAVVPQHFIILGAVPHTSLWLLGGVVVARMCITDLVAYKTGEHAWRCANTKCSWTRRLIRRGTNHFLGWAARTANPPGVALSYGYWCCCRRARKSLAWLDAKLESANHRRLCWLIFGLRLVPVPLTGYISPYMAAGAAGVRLRWVLPVSGLATACYVLWLSWAGHAVDLVGILGHLF